MKYYSKSTFDTILQESAIHRVGTALPDPRYKKIFFEAISANFVLTEGVKENLNSMIDELMFFFKNTAANNLRVSDLLFLQNKTKALGGLVSDAPALTKALTLLSKEVVTGDRLKILIKYWFQYILQGYTEISPIVAFNKELNVLRSSLESVKEHETLQGESKYIDHLLGPDGLVPVLKKISEKLIMGADKLNEPEEEKETAEDELMGGVITHDRFKPFKKAREGENVSGLFNFYQERGVPKNKVHESIMLEALIRALATD